MTFLISNDALTEFASIESQVRLSLLVLWSMGLGGLLGLERERLSKASGVRTHMLVAASSTIVVFVSAEVAGINGDMSRGIHGVITGIGFLGAGAIIQSKKGVVTGLTTAATIFHTAAIGVAVAVGYGIAATIGTVLAVIVLYGIGKLSYRYSQNRLDDGNGEE
jgi:putative Mg2+ transporter-C (MgtC) family protein